MYTYIPISPPSCISLLPSLSHPSRWSQSTELISLCNVAASHQLSILHLVVYICQCNSLTSSQLPLPPPRVLKSILYVSVFIPVLPLCIYGIYFFLLSDKILSKVKKTFTIYYVFRLLILSVSVQLIPHLGQFCNLFWERLDYYTL